MTSAPAGETRRNGALPLIPARWFVTAIALSILILGLLMMQADVSIAIAASSTALFGIAGGVTAGIAYLVRDPRSNGARIVRDLSEYVGVLAIMSLMGAVACYPVAALSHGFADSALARADAMLHFDWKALYALVVAHPTLQMLGAAAYASIFASPAILLVHYAVTHKRAEARMFLAGFWVAAIITLTAFWMVPSVGPLAYMWHDPISYMPASALYEAELIPVLRDHMLPPIDLGALRGLVGAPSFHTASALLFMTAAWRADRLRWPLIALNAAMLLATPVEGNHYLSDMLCGALVAIAAILIVRGAMRLFLNPPFKPTVERQAFALN